MQTNRPVDFEDVEDQPGLALWLETRDAGLHFPYTFLCYSGISFAVFIEYGREDVTAFSRNEYGITWRCWLDKPLKEDMDRYPWPSAHTSNP